MFVGDHHIMNEPAAKKSKIDRHMTWINVFAVPPTTAKGRN